MAVWRVENIMTKEKILVGVAKLGNIGTSLPLELLLDERADRKDLDVRVVGSGAKMGESDSVQAIETLVTFKPDLALVSSPNATLPGPTKAREILAENGIPTIIITDDLGKKAFEAFGEDIEGKGQGYFIMRGDPIIGARREFLDPTEMVLFNTDVLKVLAISGALALITHEVVKVFDQLKQGGSVELPRLKIDTKNAIAHARFKNPYAAAKATAAHEMTKLAAGINARACFRARDMEEYVHLAASGHELVRTAANLAMEARELEKGNDVVLREPHKHGELLTKRELISKPRSKSEG